MVLFSSSASAQPNCKKGIPCGNSCIAANRVCHKEPAKPKPHVSTDSTPRAGAVSLAVDGKTKVWINKKSGVYHCPGSRYFGNTSAGEYSTERAAVAAG